jgi:hypothetical protein
MEGVSHHGNHGRMRRDKSVGATGPAAKHLQALLLPAGLLAQGQKMASAKLLHQGESLSYFEPEIKRALDQYLDCLSRGHELPPP